MVCGPTVWGWSLMAFTCCLTALLWFWGCLRPSWPDGKQQGYIPMGKVVLLANLSKTYLWNECTLYICMRADWFGLWTIKRTEKKSSDLKVRELIYHCSAKSCGLNSSHSDRTLSIWSFAKKVPQALFTDFTHFTWICCADRAWFERWLAKVCWHVTNVTTPKGWNTLRDF